MSFAVLLPKGVDIEELVNINPSLFPDYLKYVIHNTVMKQWQIVENKDLKGYTKVDDITHKYVSIDPIAKGGSQYKKYKDACKFLCQNNIRIKQSRSTFKNVSVLYRKEYVIDEKPYTYCFSDHFRKQPLKIEFINDRKIIEKMKQTHTKIDPIFKSGQYKFLLKYFNPQKLKINLEEAADLCQQRHEKHKDYNKYIKELMQIVNIYNGIYRLSYKSNSIGRVYTNITQLPKVYRKFITYNNEKLIEVDISNSVIFFLSKLIDNTINYNTLENILLNNNIKLNKKGELSNLLMFSKSFESISQKEIELYREFGNNGKFYNLFIEEFDNNFSFETMKYLYEKDNDDEYLATYSQKRKVSKKQILSMLFAKPSQFMEVQEIFKIKFPDVMERLNDFKNKVGYEIFSYLLFQIEAIFVLDIVARKFNNEYCKKAPIFTLHDCIITADKYENELQVHFEKDIAQILGSAPKTKIDKI